MDAHDLRQRIGALAAIAGGAAWAIKGAAIIVTGAQPVAFFEIGAPLFVVALAGLHATVAPQTRGALVGLASLIGGAFCFIAGAVMAALQPSWRPIDESLTPVGVIVLAGAVLIQISLAFLGRRVQVEHALPGAQRHLPIALAIGALPALALGAALADVGGERLLELPLLVIAACWMALGGAMLRRS